MKSSKQIATGALLSAAAVVLMFLGSLVPFATFTVPAIASLAVLYFVLEYGRGFALLVFTAISFLSIFLIPDKEVALLFVGFFGYYPILKNVFERIQSNFIRRFLKAVVFNASMLLLYWLLSRFLLGAALLQELQAYTPVLLALLAFLANITFPLYDIALSRLIMVYVERIGPRLR